MLVVLNEGNENSHKGAYVERELVDADSVVAVRERHNEKVCRIKADCQNREYAENLVFSVFALVAENEGEQNCSAEYNKQVEKMPLVEKTYLGGGIILAE